MIHQNLKTLRKNKGFTQEELAARLNVVRQTVSKWEKGLSVPDAEMTSKLAEILEVPVSQLLGAKIEDVSQPDQIAQQLARINEQLIIKNRRSRRIWKTVASIIGVIITVHFVLIFLALLFSYTSTVNTQLPIEATQFIG